MKLCEYQTADGRRAYFVRAKHLLGVSLLDETLEKPGSSNGQVGNGTLLFTLCWKNAAVQSQNRRLCWANTVVSDQEEEAIRIWILICWCFLTVGILLGSWWAYHELGWGGWWFWDPVENASFMPWVLATACIHSVILPLLHSWTLFLNIVTFLCCVLGTFSIRSGLLASVHSFATDDTRGIFLWRFFLLMTGISILLFSQMKQQIGRKEMGFMRKVISYGTGFLISLVLMGGKSSAKEA